MNKILHILEYSLKFLSPILSILSTLLQIFSHHNNGGTINNDRKIQVSIFWGLIKFSDELKECTTFPNVKMKDDSQKNNSKKSEIDNR